MRRRWTPAFRLSWADQMATLLMAGVALVPAVIGVVALTGLRSDLPVGVGAITPMPAVMFAVVLRFRLVNVYVGEDGVLLRFPMSTRLLPWDTIATVDTVTCNGAFDEFVGEEVWFDLTDGSAADTPVCHASWLRSGLMRTGIRRTVLSRYRYDEDFERLREIVLERAAGEIKPKPAAAPPRATYLSARRSAAWSKHVD
ncbi:hypothetical protein [Kutzneria buriramensis]|uniref:PH (Pleckstrin Homology) domain-containing protein n=1 Tax=Kutzneria buriramensis TaxID=1045776 RepID=A0A3E0HE24_9PSEU|nr:hypothetical protein [Kutzneria buriramensis]REH43519.1 hypothetical protein BCF44_10962 [Kutzneria buriramensis]